MPHPSGALHESDDTGQPVTGCVTRFTRISVTRNSRSDAGFPRKNVFVRRCDYVNFTML